MHTTLQIGAFRPRVPRAVVTADAVVGPEPDLACADSNGKNVIGSQAVFLGVVRPGRDLYPIRLSPSRPGEQHNSRGRQ